MKRARIIYNPSSGRELIKKHLPYILQRLEQAGYEASAHATMGEGCAKEAAQVASERGYDLVIAAGGDGTIFEVVNGLAEKEYRPTLGVIPAGTTNDFAGALGIPRNIKKCCDIFCEGHKTPIDIGKAGEKYFINVAAVGALTEITYNVPSRWKTVFGRLAYFIKGIESLRYLSPKHVRIEYDDNIYEGEILFFLLCNSNSVGGFDKLAMNSKLDDGLFDLLIVEKMNIAKLVQAGILTLRGKHLQHAKVKYFTAKKLNVSMDKNNALNLDGEYGGMLPNHFENLTHHLNILIPKNKPTKKRIKLFKSKYDI